MAGLPYDQYAGCFSKYIFNSLAKLVLSYFESLDDNNLKKV
jgi:hypothetical protein